MHQDLNVGRREVGDHVGVGKEWVGVHRGLCKLLGRQDLRQQREVFKKRCEQVFKICAEVFNQRCVQVFKERR